MRIYGWKNKANWYADGPRKEETCKSAERMKQKKHCEDVKRSIPPILINGLEKICKETHEDGDIQGGVLKMKLHLK